MVLQVGLNCFGQGKPTCQTGNGKTITIKAIIQMCAERGITPLYVKSLQRERFIRESELLDVEPSDQIAGPRHL